ncbi:hypothetical protein J2Z76_001834 [Sedimentibacter acidaminivorans]|jgi:D-glutamate cyclase-like protein|uniref:D-glutamate cyclase-like C-terminal domain-containing protein n=1 Tax=Sedimentibacter acidaminivorans TaxID=913099 RepID=A0ABS4GE47_9FIRM|nr:DUF4392 domain-containing protein [Sedimentibacter acidaminivorans]MBP1925970.1 hypothetical protein [Sedimentibacter acidaminivorans]
MKTIYYNKFDELDEFNNLNVINAFEKIEEIISLNLENRGMDKIKLEGQLKSCVISLNTSDTVVIVTGFAIKSAKIGETDGPPGALALAYALENLNKKVIIVTDKYSEVFLRDGVKILNLNSEIYIFEENKENEQASEIIKKYRPNHIIGIERPGRSVDNKCYSMNGDDITLFCSNTDLLFIKARDNNIPTSAIGDGGNEVGMGKVRELVSKYVNKGNLICAEVETDNLLIAGVSNWGAYGICAALSIINNDMVMYDEETYEEISNEMLKKGAVDGCSKKNEATVDGLSYEQNLKVFLKLRLLSQMNFKSLVV